MEKTYIAIDLKSFYASVECREIGLDPLTTNLVVADKSRTAKTICLAVTPALKSFGVPGRPRLFEVEQKVKLINEQRRVKAGIKSFKGSSYSLEQLNADPTLKLDYIVAKPRMAHYMRYSVNIYNIYRKYIGEEDIHVYSIDEVFIDASSYLKVYNMTAKELAMVMIKDIFNTTGITATCGIGTNLYLCKVAMDIVAKHMEPDENGVRIAQLDEISYREKLWEHEPLTDFWHVGQGISRRLRENGMYNMGDVAVCSIEDPNKLYRLFGVNGEVLIDHSWGYEPCTIKDIKNHKSKSQSLSCSQVLPKAYTNQKARMIVMEMAESFALDLVSKKLVTDQIVLHIAYDVENMDNAYNSNYVTDTVIDHYGRIVPKPSHGSLRLDYGTSSTKLLKDKYCQLFDKVANKGLLVRKITLSAAVCDETLGKKEKFKQYDLFSEVDEQDDEKKKIAEEKERRVQQTILEIKKRYGKNAVINVADLQEDATTIKRNGEIGGHQAE